jgi:hypothetical protein
MCILLRRLRRQVLSSKSTKAEKSSALLCQMFDIIHKKRPQAGENTNERFPSDMLSRDPHVCTSTKFALVRDQIVLLKYQISGLGVSEYLIHPSVAKKTREREKVSRLYHTQTRARKGEERERAAVLIMKKSSGSSFQNLQGALNFVSSKSGVII